MRRTAVLLSCLLTSGCGVTTQDRPVPLVTSSVEPAATPTLTQRPDPSSSSSTPPPPTTTAATPSS